MIAKVEWKDGLVGFAELNFSCILGRVEPFMEMFLQTKDTSNT